MTHDKVNVLANMTSKTLDELLKMDRRVSDLSDLVRTLLSRGTLLENRVHELEEK